VCIYIGMSMHY